MNDDWLQSSGHWRTVIRAAMELKWNPDPLFAELGQAFHAYEISQDRDALADALNAIDERMKDGR